MYTWCVRGIALPSAKAIGHNTSSALQCRKYLQSRYIALKRHTSVSSTAVAETHFMHDKTPEFTTRSTGINCGFSNKGHLQKYNTNQHVLETQNVNSYVLITHSYSPFVTDRDAHVCMWIFKNTYTDELWWIKSSLAGFTNCILKDTVPSHIYSHSRYITPLNVCFWDYDTSWCLKLC